MEDVRQISIFDTTRHLHFYHIAFEMQSDHQKSLCSQYLRFNGVQLFEILFSPNIVLIQIL